MTRQPVIRTGVVGAAGKMGRALVALVHESEALTLAAAVERPGLPEVGADAGLVAGIEAAGIAITDDLAAVAGEIDVLMDFTVAEATLANIEICHGSDTRMVIGTTGLPESARSRLTEISRQVPIVCASNYSIGVNAAFRLVQMAARIFGESADVEIVEAHHRHKIDAPSGTALALGEYAAKGLGRNLADVAQHGRHGHTGERKRQTIGFHAIRGGEIIGEHRVMFIAGGERLEIAHLAQSRANFAEGAVRAATWIVGQPPGLYDMLDVLDLPR